MRKCCGPLCFFCDAWPAVYLLFVFSAIGTGVSLHRVMSGSIFDAAGSMWPVLAEWRVQGLLEGDASLVSVRDKHGNTPLHAAVVSGSLGTVEYVRVVCVLLDFGADALAINSRGLAPLDVCIADYARISFADSLLGAGSVTAFALGRLLDEISENSVRHELTPTEHLSLLARALELLPEKELLILNNPTYRRFGSRNFTVLYTLVEALRWYPLSRKLEQMSDAWRPAPGAIAPTTVPPLCLFNSMRMVLARGAADTAALLPLFEPGHCCSVRVGLPPLVAPVTLLHLVVRHLACLPLESPAIYGLSKVLSILVSSCAARCQGLREQLCRCVETDLNVLDGAQRSPIFYAGDAVTILALRNAGADCRNVDDEGLSPLDYALRRLCLLRHDSTIAEFQRACGGVHRLAEDAGLVEWLNGGCGFLPTDYGLEECRAVRHLLDCN